MAHLKEFEVGSASTWRWLGKRRLALLFVELDALARDLGPTHEVHVNVHHFGGHDPCTVVNAYVDGSGPGLPAVMPRTFANEHVSRREAKADLLAQAAGFCRAVRGIRGVGRGPAVVG